jgi:uncharacterized membrane protein YeaQ/YmgE (transglycosylase-associated protein family)
MDSLSKLMSAMLGSWLVLNLLGALAIGALARFLLPGKDKVGWLTTIGVGFLGGIAANFVAHLAGWVPPGKNSGLLGSLLGAMALLLLHRVWVMARKVRSAPPPPAA